MAKAIPITLDPSDAIEIDGAAVAVALGLEAATFRQLMEQRKVVQLCERGTGEDAGLYRATFYHQDRRARLVLDREGRIIGSIET